MEYRQFGSTYYVRLDRGDEIISSILNICRTEHIESAVYSGIGGCSEESSSGSSRERNACLD